MDDMTAVPTKAGDAPVLDHDGNGAPAWSKKEAEAKRAEATDRAARKYLSLKRAGNADASVKDCCDLAARETGYPRPAETSVRRLLPKLMTPEEKEEKKRLGAKADRRAAATRRAAEIYRETNGDDQGDGNEAVVMSVTRACDTVEPEYGVRPAETSVRRLLGRMYEEEGIRPRKKTKPSPPSKAAKTAGVAAAAVLPLPREQLDDSDLPLPRADAPEYSEPAVLVAQRPPWEIDLPDNLPPLPALEDIADVVGV